MDSSKNNLAVQVCLKNDIDLMFLGMGKNTGAYTSFHTPKGARLIG